MKIFFLILLCLATSNIVEAQGLLAVKGGFGAEPIFRSYYGGLSLRSHRKISFRPEFEFAIVETDEKYAYVSGLYLNIPMFLRIRPVSSVELYAGPVFPNIRKEFRFGTEYLINDRLGIFYEFEINKSWQYYEPMNNYKTNTDTRYVHRAGLTYCINNYTASKNRLYQKKLKGIREYRLENEERKQYEEPLNFQNYDKMYRSITTGIDAGVGLGYATLRGNINFTNQTAGRRGKINEFGVSPLMIAIPLLTSGSVLLHSINYYSGQHITGQILQFNHGLDMGVILGFRDYSVPLPHVGYRIGLGGGEFFRRNNLLIDAHINFNLLLGVGPGARIGYMYASKKSVRTRSRDARF